MYRVPFLTSFRLPTATLAAALLASCAPPPAPGDELADDDVTDDDATDDDVTDDPIPLPATGGCGAPEYDWVPPDGLGGIVAWEPALDLSLDAAVIDALLIANGIGVFSPVPYGARVYRVRYLTQDRGHEVEATALLSYPATDQPVDVPSVMWGHGTTGMTDACAPSAAGIEGGVASVLLAALGFATAAPDYLGLNGIGDPAGFLHPYLVPEAAAVASLDALRALWRFADEGLDPELRASPERRTVMWGASEGGFAALWADRYAGSYAPEVQVVATVASVPPTDLLGLATYAVASPNPATIGLAGAFATQQPWYGGTTPLSDVLTDSDPSFLASSLPAALLESCDGGGVLSGLDAVADVFQPDFVEAATASDWDAAEPWSCYMGQATLAETDVERGHDAPVLLQISAADDLVAADVGRADLPRLCERGYRIDYLECAGAGHAEGAALSLPFQWRWLAARLAGEPLDDEGLCAVTEPIDCSVFLAE